MLEENYMTVSAWGRLGSGRCPELPKVIGANSAPVLSEGGSSKGSLTGWAFDATALLEGAADKAKVDDLEAAIFCAPWFCH